MIDAILSHHSDGHTCGVAKFNQRLAKELGIPCYGLNTIGFTHPLISVMTCEDGNWWDNAMCRREYDLFLHDQPEGGIGVHAAIRKASRVFAANAEIATGLSGIRPDIISSWCPSTIQGNPTRGAINVLTFGMAHKIQTARYEKLKALLDATGEDYTVSLSTAVHEGSPWSSVATVPEKLRAIFGDRLRVLGYLADDALAKELQECTAVALFYEPALRSNNTTYFAARHAGCVVVTNMDSYSPDIDPWTLGLDTIDSWPMFLREPRRHDYPMVRRYTWHGLLDQIRQPVSV